MGRMVGLGGQKLEMSPFFASGLDGPGLCSYPRHCGRVRECWLRPPATGWLGSAVAPPAAGGGSLFGHRESVEPGETLSDSGFAGWTNPPAPPVEN